MPAVRFSQPLIVVLPLARRVFFVGCIISLLSEACWSYSRGLQRIYHGETRLHLLGTHGTSRTRAEAIVASKAFLATGDGGHAGPGIYFWAYETNVELAKHLAQLWWATYLRWNKYETDADTTCAVVDVAIRRPESDAYYDATSLAFREALASMAASFGDCEGFEVGPAISYLIDQIEVKSGVKVLVMKASVKSPAHSKKPSLVARDFPMSEAYVVRSGGECLLEKIEIIN